jgi:type I restriction enzyme M protein
MTKKSETTKSSPKTQTTAQRLNSIIKSCRDIMRKDRGLSSDVDRLPQLTWLMFLKFLDDLEKTEELVHGEKYQSLVPAPYRWRDWASEKTGLTGEELVAFIQNDEAVLPNGKRGMGLLTQLRSLRGTIEYDRRDVIANVFKDTYNRMVNGFLLKDVIDKINEIHFDASEEVSILGDIYESILQQMRDSAGDAGEFYTPRAVVRFMVTVINPRLGEVLEDPACGTGGFLVESFKHLQTQVKTLKQRSQLQRHSLRGVEVKPLPYLLCQMNLLLHGLEAPAIKYENALRHPLKSIDASQQVDVILTNPPFGGEEERSIQSNFPADRGTSETALLFLQLIQRKLKRGKTARAAVVVPNGTLFGDGVCARVKEDLLKHFNLHTIVRLPNGVFAPYTSIPTNLLFFEGSQPTTEIWFYEIPLPEGRKNYTKTKPMSFEEFAGCLAWWNQREENAQAWKVSVQEVLRYDEKGNVVAANLDIKNPQAQVDLEHLSPVPLVGEVMEKERRILELLGEIKRVLEVSL